MTRHHTPAHAGEDGFSILETMFAICLLFVVSIGLLPLGLIATTNTENQGHLMARTTEYAQDKMEQLLALSYGDNSTDTRVFPATDLGGSGLAVGGSANPAAPVNLYADYLDISGTLLPSVGGAAPANWYYQRVWAIASPSVNLKQITVTATTRTAVGSIGRVPRATVTSLKTFPF